MKLFSIFFCFLYRPELSEVFASVKVMLDPGTAGAWSILFVALAFPPEYVGTYLTYRLLTANFNGAYGALQSGLEQIEAAHKADAIDLNVLRKNSAA